MKKIYNFLLIVFIFMGAILICGCEDKNKGNDTPDVEPEEKVELISDLWELVQKYEKDGIQLHFTVWDNGVEKNIVFGKRGTAIWHVDNTDPNYTCYFETKDGNVGYTWQEEYDAFVYNHELNKYDENNNDPRIVNMFDMTNRIIVEGGTTGVYEEKGNEQVCGYDCRIVEFRATYGDDTYLIRSWYSDEYGFSMKMEKYLLDKADKNPKVFEYTLVNMELGSAVHMPTVYEKYEWHQFSEDFRMNMSNGNYNIIIERIGDEVVIREIDPSDSDNLIYAYYLKYNEAKKVYDGYELVNGQWQVDEITTQRRPVNVNEIFEDRFSWYINDERINVGELIGQEYVGDTLANIYQFHDKYEGVSYKVAYDSSLKMITRYSKRYDASPEIEYVTYYEVMGYSTDITEFSFKPNLNNQSVSGGN